MQTTWTSIVLDRVENVRPRDVVMKIRIVKPGLTKIIAKKAVMSIIWIWGVKNLVENVNW